MLTKYGLDNIIIMLGLGIILIVGAFFIGSKWISYPVAALGIVLAVFTFWFFRDPDRTVPEAAILDESIVISPADGKVVEIVREFEPYYLKSEVIRISIFLSPLDVHVNRAPVGGVVEYFDYKSGDYLVAYHPKSSEKNEQTHIGMKNNKGAIFFKQIVGVLARRLVWDIKTGDALKVGQRFGMMKFGSRMDIMINPASEVYIKIGDKVVAGESIIAKMK
jgi:phosphatidylserine decarboxylase